MAKVRKAHKTLKELRRQRGLDLFTLGVSLYCAYVLMTSGAIEAWIEGAAGYAIVASFTAGIFFTSLFTLAPSIVALAELSKEMSFWGVAIPGAAGSVVGDLFLFLFLRKVVVTNIQELWAGRWSRKWLSLLGHPLLQWIIPAAGLVAYAMPMIPDEVGLSLMGLTKMRIAYLIPLTFAVNIFSIGLIWFAARGFFG